jgi:hypothetical protein
MQTAGAFAFAQKAALHWLTPQHARVEAGWDGSWGIGHSSIDFTKAKGVDKYNQSIGLD